MKLWISASLLLLATSLNAQSVQQTKGNFEDKFRQLNEVLPTPNIYRNAAGEPGYAYWQQQVDYEIQITLDEELKRLEGTVDISYQNNSPDTLRYLWLQLDQNIFRNDSMSELTNTFAGIGRRGPATALGNGDDPAELSISELRRQQFMADTELGYDIQSIEAANGDALNYLIVGTNMRIDLPRPLSSGDVYSFSIDYAYNIVEEDAVWARSGYEHFPDDAREGGNHIFLIAQWYPRLHAYTDYEAWTNREFLGRGEFTLEFGDYQVAITLPADHLVSSTGELQNPNQVLTATQRERLREAETADRPVFIVTEEEALENEAEGTEDTKTWRFEAENVRDFAWASSRKFIWDAQGYNQGGEVQPLVMAMSFYPKEGEPLWSNYSTASVVHTMEVYSRFSFDYPYPVAQSVNGPVGGMEYPMITFNGPRTEPPEEDEGENENESASDGNVSDERADSDEPGERTYSLAEKRFLIGVVIHEIGHIYFPMTVNSDEREWTWMDEGLNSFLDGIASREWDPDIPWGVEARDITGYMESSIQAPIMTQSDSVLRLGPNAYTKPAVALNILREVVLGRDLFDFAFKEYSRRWAFKRPTPSDFFRTMEEASGVDLDWFWRGWFYTTDHVDISLDSIYSLRIDTANPDIDFDRQRQEAKDEPISLFVERNRELGLIPWVETNTYTPDFHDDNDRFTVTNKDRNSYQGFLDGLDDWEREAFERAVEEDKNYYILQFSNLGGLVSPILLQLNYVDGTSEEMNIPAEIWRRTPEQVHKLLVLDKELEGVVVDHLWETADVDIENNFYPRRIIPSRIEAYQDKEASGLVYRDIMRDSQVELDSDEDDADADADADAEQEDSESE
tara:strand:- start:12146 stop:14698 length:2553 start_codon:yes stop_codon:yes gene_type:complete